MRAGNTQAFGEIVSKYQIKVVSVVRNMLGANVAVEDVVQEVFMRFYQSIHQFRGDAQLATYLTRIAMNLSLNELARSKRRSWLYFFHKNDEASPVLQIADTVLPSPDSDLKESIDKALQQLSTEMRAVVVLRLVQGYSTEETAQILDIPYGTVLSRLNKARGLLQEQLVDYR